MNRESLPLICALLIPIVLVAFFMLNYFEYDVISFLLNVNVLYYIIIFPIVLGFVVIIVKFMRPN